MGYEINEILGEWTEINDTIVYRITRDFTNIVDIEQLEELKRADELFLTCSDYQINDEYVEVKYQKRDGFIALSMTSRLDTEMQLRIANQLTKTELLLGRQFTTYIVPQSIYYNAEGEIVLAHRGIRHVLPPLELTELDLFYQVQNVIIQLFSSYELSQAKKLVEKAQSFRDLKLAIQVDLNEIRKQREELITSEESNKLPQNPQQNIPVVTQESPLNNDGRNEQYQDFAGEQVNQNIDAEISLNVSQSNSMSNKPKIQKNLIYAILIGLCVGVLLTYVIKVIPSDKQVSANQEESKLKEKELLKEKSKIKSELDQEKLTQKGYYAAIQGDSKQAVESLEKVKEANEATKQILVQQYMLLNTVVTLNKAVMLDETKELEVVNRLTAMNTPEANEAILKMKSNNNEVLIEQAHLQKNDTKVIELYNGMKDNQRAKRLAFNAYINLSKPAEAIQISRELKDKKLEIIGLKKELSMVEADKKKKSEDKKKQVDAIKDNIKKLEGK